MEKGGGDNGLVLIMGFLDNGGLTSSVGECWS